MMWNRHGKICDSHSWNLKWHVLNTQLPIPYLIEDDKLRLYLTFCDELNRGRLGYVDVNPDNPSEIIDYSREPLLDIGEKGYFDENGVVPTAMLVEKNRIYLYYCGFQKQVNYPYSSLAGVAVSLDGGNSFERVKDTPLLERKDGEMFIRTGVGIYKYGSIYRLYYASGNEWISLENKLVPKYSFRYIESDSPISFEGTSYRLFPLTDDEFGMTTPQIIEKPNGYAMVYSIRSISNGYRMGYATSSDGINFVRDDKFMNIDRPKGEFDSEMICYGKVFFRGKRTYLFYSGNHYGMDGIGWAELSEK